MLYMVIEHFKDGAAPAIYERVQRHGRMTPPGLHYVASWVEQDFSRCFQIMETETPSLFDEWMQIWSDLVEFEVRAVRSASDAAALMNAARDQVDRSGNAVR